jgi:hypothetical protein
VLKPKIVKCSIIASLASAMLSVSFVGCGSSSNQVNNVANQSAPSFRVIEPATIGSGDNIVSALDLEAFDAQGNRVAGPIEVDFANVMEFPALPDTATTVELDYLRNGGFPLYRATFPVNGGSTRNQGTSAVVTGQTVNDPDEQPVDAPTTSWLVEQQPDDGFRLKLTHTDQVGDVTTTPDFRLKGVCYSPSPINVVGDGSPNIGDFFFDDVINPDNGNTDFFNWFSLWGHPTQLYTDPNRGETYRSRGDLEIIRKHLGANTIRVYSFMSRQQSTVGDGRPEFPDPDEPGNYHYQHKQFLDECYNNNNNPVYVLVGIATPAELWYLREQDVPAKQAKIKLYLRNLEEVVKDVADHPAVLGFTLVNEINDGDNAYPSATGVMRADHPEEAITNAESDFYWGRMKAYSDQTKTSAPDKLVGAAFHDFREIAQYSSAVPDPGPTYLEQLANLDFVGINTYHTGDYPDVFQKGWLGDVPPAMRKPVIWTELGFSATTRPDIADPITGFGDTAESRQKVADRLTEQLPRAHANSGVLGMYYFEYCDEWWKQTEDSETRPNPYDPANTVQVRRADRWYGGPLDGGFPNGTHDQEGFGLYSVARFLTANGRIANDAPVINAANNGPDGRIDSHTERTEITGVLIDFYKSLTPRE